MFYNQPNQVVAVYAFDTEANAPKTGDAANITAYISKDGASMVQSDDIHPTELDSTNAPGVYVFSLTQAETECGVFILFAKSSTNNVLIDPVVCHTGFSFSNYGYLGSINGKVDTIQNQVGVTIPNLLTVIDTVVDGIKAVTDNIPDSGTMTSIATASALAGGIGAILSLVSTVDGHVLAQNDISASDVVSALKSSTGWTQGDTWNFAKVVNVITAWSVGDGKEKSGSPGVAQLLDPDDETTVVMELSVDDDSPYKTVSVLI